MSKCLIHGNNLLDEDKQAQSEAKRQLVPHVTLLKARLLFDGGYYQNGLATLEKIKIGDLNDVQVEEYHYRRGRCQQSVKQYNEAIASYLLIANNQSTSFFVAGSCLQLAMIYENQKKLASAKAFYEKCLQLNPAEYKNSLHQKAKSGLERVGK